MDGWLASHVPQTSHSIDTNNKHSREPHITIAVALWLALLVSIASHCANAHRDTQPPRTPVLPPHFSTRFRGLLLKSSGLLVDTIHDGLDAPTHELQTPEPLVPLPITVQSTWRFQVEGAYFYDQPNKRWSLSILLRSVDAPREAVEMFRTRQFTDGMLYSSINGVCPTPPSPGFFSQPWSNYFVYDRTVVENGRALYVYRYITLERYVVLDGETGAPVRMSNSQYSAVAVNGTHSDFSLLRRSLYNIEFFDTQVYGAGDSNDTARTIIEDPAVYQPPALCLNQTEITPQGSTGGLMCPTQSSSIATISMVRAHSPDDYLLRNHNTANLRGDLQCVPSSSSSSSSLSSLSLLL